MPLSDYDLLLILHGNMRKGLKVKLAGKRYETSAQLFDDCVHIEKDWRQISYVPEKSMAMVQSAQSNRTPQFKQQFTPRSNSRQTANVNEIQETELQPAEFLNQNIEVCAMGSNPSTLNK